MRYSASPRAKKKQIEQVLKNFKTTKPCKILELFSGRGNLTGVYEKYGDVTACDKKYLNTGDSFLLFHKHIYDKAKYDIIDIDAYGFPNRFFPDIFLLLTNGFMFVTMPKPYVNILNGITQAHLISYYGQPNPDKKCIVEKIANWGICHWRKVTLVNEIDLKSVWRFAFYVEKVKATEYTGVRNR